MKPTTPPNNLRHIPAPKVDPAPPNQVTVNIGGQAIRFTMGITAEVVDKRKKRKPVVKFPGPIA